MPKEINFHIQDYVGWLIVNRPAARNALNWTAQAQFAAVVDQVAADASVRVLVITGAGDKAFVAGGDLKELSQYPEPEAGVRLNETMGRALQRLTELSIPVIGAVNGDAFGGGCEILSACDLRLAAGHARFGFAQVRQALTTGWGGTGRVVRLLGLSRALDLLLTARVFDAEEALWLGWVHDVVPKDELETAVAALAQQLAALPGEALAATKQLAYAATTLSLQECNQLESRLFTHLWPRPDHLEATAAFLQKRPPRFNQD